MPLRPLRKKRVSNASTRTSIALNNVPPMGDERSHRVDDALSTLIARLVLQNPDEDDATADERHEHNFDLAKNIIEGYSRALITLRMRTSFR
jgi:hypothetical protein